MPSRLLPLVFLVLALLSWLIPLSARAQGPVDVAPVVDEILARGDAAVAAYTPETRLEAGTELSALYFEVFEARGLELELGLKDNALKLNLESRFAALNTQALRGEAPEKLRATWNALRAALLEVKARFGAPAEASPWSAGLQSFLILLREGVEALLVVAALAAYVARQGSPSQARALWGGVAAAVVLSLVSAWALARLVANAGATREVIEGVSMLAAAGVLIYVSYWLFAKREAARWQAYIKQQVQAAVSRGSLIALALAGFLAVYREGAETVLFYQALIAGQPGQGPALLAGAGAAALVLAGVYLALRTGSRRLPLGQFFGATAVLLYLLAFSFTGKGVVELQTAGWLPATRLEWGPELPLLGVFPTLESLLPQALLLVAGGWVLMAVSRNSASMKQAA